MKNKRIFIMLLTLLLFYKMPITVYAGEILNTEKEGLNTDTIELDGTISMLNDSGGIKNSLKKYGKAFINTYPGNRGYLWVCLIKGFGGLQVCYYGGDSFQTIDEGVYIQSAHEFGNPPTLEKPSYSLDISDWSCFSLSSPFQFGEFMMWFGSECGYEFNINVDSSLPIYYKSFNSMNDYSDWYRDGGFNLDKFPDQDYSTTGFTVKGDLDDGSDYDLEVPKDLKCKGFDSSTIVSSFKADKVLTWNQSDNLNVKDWYTEIYLREVGTFKRYIWSAKESFDSGYTKKWNLYGSVLNAKRKYTFKFDDIKAYPCTPGGEESGGISQITDYYVKMRNTYYDETTKRTHYSNWITWHIDDKGNVDCVENEDHDVTNTDKDDVKIDSENYKPGEDYTNKNKDTTSDSFTLDSFLSYLRQAVDTVGEVPTMLGTVFSWLPAVFTTMIVCGIGLLVLLRILNR